jgi:hypothetical protein
MFTNTEHHPPATTAVPSITGIGMALPPITRA